MTSASRIAARAAVLTLAIVLAAACGSARGYENTHRLEPAVVQLLERRLMRFAPRQPGSASTTHVRRVHCRKLSDRDFRCRAVLGDGSQLTVPVRVSADGRRFDLK